MANSSENQVDIYRDTFIRYIGYSNELGEAFRTWVPSPVVAFSYVLASGYVIADAFDKGHRAYIRYQNNERLTRQNKVALTVFDVLLWQSFASVLLPGLTINRLCKISTAFFINYNKLSRKTAQLSSTAIGLAAIPLIVRPIDTAVEFGMNATIRKYYDIHPLPVVHGMRDH